ncbi:hypothetical protein [uncultured Roseobacter sp.]|uniref:hypothetical protein n=1 Tax=uncultured Roseobacter sp. TaxID=114847 RepID=UPI0026106F38|nr:hypothetical protein [uncultured Roseobacter sp.]
MRYLLVLLVLFCGPAAHADRATYIELAKRGWSYELRTTMIGRDLSIPVLINGRQLAGASLCVVGERPRRTSLEVIDSFRALLLQTYGKPMTMRYAGQDASACGSGRTVILRLYSGFPPNTALSADLQWMDRTYQLELPGRGYFAATSPAMAQTFFGRQGQGTHIMVKQPAAAPRSRIEAAFYKSILIEELFQSFTFGMDILIFDRSVAWRSKLQETPLNLWRLPWESPAFMRALVRSNPPGLCTFDVFMMYAVAEAPVDQTNEPAFIEYVDANYDDLYTRAQATMGDPAYAAILDPVCAAPDL